MTKSGKPVQKRDPWEGMVASWFNKRNKVEPSGLVGKAKSLPVRTIRLPEARVIWWKIVERECREKVKFQGVEYSWQRMSIEWLSAIFNHEFDFEIANFLMLSNSTMEDYLEWKESELYKVVTRISNAAVDEYAGMQYAAGVKMLAEKMKKGSNKAADSLFKSIGKADGVPLREYQPKIEWTKTYVIQPGGKIAEEKMQVTISQPMSEGPKFPELLPPEKK